MKDYLDERIAELRRRYKETADIRWLHRFNEATHIREKLVLRQIDSEQTAGQHERRTVLAPDHPNSVPGSNG